MKVKWRRVIFSKKGVEKGVKKCKNIKIPNFTKTQYVLRLVTSTEDFNLDDNFSFYLISCASELFATSSAYYLVRKTTTLHWNAYHTRHQPWSSSSSSGSRVILPSHCRRCPLSSALTCRRDRMVTRGWSRAQAIRQPDTGTKWHSQKQLFARSASQLIRECDRPFAIFTKTKQHVTCTSTHQRIAVAHRQHRAYVVGVPFQQPRCLHFADVPDLNKSTETTSIHRATSLRFLSGTNIIIEPILGTHITTTKNARQSRSTSQACLAVVTNTRKHQHLSSLASVTHPQFFIGRRADEAPAI